MPDPKKPINPFGDKLTDNIYDRFVPNGFDYRPNYDKEIVGDYTTGPGPYRKQNALDKSKTILNSIGELVNNKAAIKEDPYKYAKPMAFGSNEKGMNFDRYYAHPDFKKNGFSPFRDNESFYNQHSSIWGDLRRTADVGLNFAWTTMGNLAPWNWNQWTAEGNRESADQYSKAMGKMMSTREGHGAWWNNLFANASYTVGIVGEMLAEEVVLAGITAATRGATAEASVPLMGGKIVNTVSKLGKVGRWSAGVIDSLKTMQNANKAREIWTSSKTILGKTGNFINPLERTTSIIKNAGKADDINKWAKGTKNFAAFYKDLRDINLVFDESRLEGGMVANDLQSELIDDFYHKNGRMPDQHEADLIYKQSQDAGGATSFANLPAIFFSNKIVFGTAFKGWQPAFMTRNAIQRSVGLDIIGNTKKGFKLANQKGFKKYLTKDYWKMAPGNLAGTVARYSSANFTEGFQEVTQEAIASAAKDYYKNTYNDPNLAGLKQGIGSIKKGAVDQISSQGLDVFLTGFLMGGVVQGPQNLIWKQGGNIYNRVTDKQGYAERKNLREKWGIHVVNALNDSIEKKKDYINWVDQNVVDQKTSGQALSDAEDNGDKKSWHDAKDDSILSNIHTMLKTGMYDHFVSSLESYKNLSPEEMKDEFGEDFSIKLEGVIKKAKDIKRLYDVIEDKYQNPFDPSKFKGDPEAYEDESSSYGAFEFAKKMALYGNYNYVRTLERMNQVRQEVANNKDLSQIASGDFSLLFDPSVNGIGGELTNLQSRIKALTGITDSEAKKELKSLEEKHKLLKTNLILISTFKQMVADKKRSHFDKNAESNISKLQDFRNGKSVMYHSKDGDVEGKVVSSGYDKNGKPYVIILSGGKKKRVSINKLTLKGKVTQNEMDVMEEVLKLLHENFKDYISHLSKDHPGVVLDEHVDNAFQKYLDFLELSHEHVSYGTLINILHDPQKFNELVVSAKKGMREAQSEKKSLMLEAIEKFLKQYDANDLLNQLEDLGVKLVPEEASKLISDGTLPTKFIDSATDKVIPEDSPKYQELIDFLNNYKALEEVPTDIIENPENPVPPTPPAPTGPIKPTSRAVSPADPVSEMPKDLIASLDSSFKAYNEKLKADGERPLTTTDGWQTWVRENMIAFNIIQEWNKSHGLGEISIPEVEEPEVTETPEEFVPPVKEKEEKPSNEIEIVSNIDNLKTITQIHQSPSGKFAVLGYEDMGIMWYDTLEDAKKAVEYNIKKTTKDKPTGLFDDNGILLPVDEEANPDNYRGLQVLDTDRITTATGEHGAAQYDPVKKRILINRKFLKEKFKEKAWTKPRKQSDGSFAKALPEDTFDNYEQWEQFVMEHEYQHSLLSRQDFGYSNGVGAYETEINNRALKALDLLKEKTRKEEIEDEIKVLNDKIKSIKGSPIGFTVSKLQPGNTKWDDKGNKVAFVKSQRDKYNRGKELYRINDSYDLTVDFKQRPTQGWSDSKEIPFDAEYSENPKELFDKIALLEKELNSLETPIIESKVDPLFQGKVVYFTPGMGKTTAVEEDPNLVDADDLLVEQIKQFKGYEKTTNETVGSDIFKLYKEGMADQMDKVYDTVWNQIQALTRQGKTVLTGTLRYIPKADYVFASKSNDPMISQFARKGTTNAANSVKRYRDAEAASDKRVIVDATAGDIIFGIVPPISTGKESSILEKIDAKFNSIETLKDLQDFQVFFGDVISDVDLTSTLGLDLESWENKIAEKKTELGENVNFADIKKGTTLVMKDTSVFKNKGLATVISKDKYKIKVRPMGVEEGAIRVISKSQVKDQVNYIYTDEALIERVNEVTKEAIQNGQVNTETQKNLDASSRKEARDDAKKASKKDIDDDFINSTGCK